MLMAIGLFAFGLPTLLPDQLQRRSSWKHAGQSRVGAPDASQYLGPGEDRITLPGTLLPELAGSFEALRTLRTMADVGDAYPLVLGTGQVLGLFVIKSLDETGTFLMVDGVARKTDFSIELDRVG